MPIETICDTPDYTHIVLHANLDTAGANEIDLEFHARTAALRKNAIVDIAEADIIASLAMGMLLGCAQSLKRHNKKMIIINATPLCADAMRTVRMDQIIHICDSLEDALLLIPPRTPAT